MANLDFPQFPIHPTIEAQRYHMDLARGNSQWNLGGHWIQRQLFHQGLGDYETGEM